MSLTENEKKVIEALRKIAKRSNDAEVRIDKNGECYRRKKEYCRRINGYQVRANGS